ncbi:hypothetical protein GYMLUDRAFT_818877 [Collybiopsis luxurians FD-317 M1]|uniref:Unplaced genomic scaffold GYMLUscaffold_50, whole genome shotgun sequence n=1 Tax=Collybiopsis luxurians FD-317 M1 TaxID=944289 RepID=A0A0D0CME9_9AGAR|nr:hypothetical protein GYMLUDRAFT_818877 [Collybiopsis luxurians FD-317 M1]
MTSPPPSSYSPTSPKISKRSSYEVLQGIAGPDSNLPLPTPSRHSHVMNGSMDDSVMGTSIGIGTSYKRVSSPTRTLSRMYPHSFPHITIHPLIGIPVASVGNARALADEGAGVVGLRSPNGTASTSTEYNNHNAAIPSSPSLQPPPSPNSNASRRVSLTPGGTTKVLADLQTGVINARNALENTKAQLRLSQRSVASLTRQTEDLKEGRERLRLENEGLNNVVARKERLLQEVLERARKAEAEATQLRTQLKSETSQSKKSLREMETALTESTALSQKSEREYVTLRESLKHLTESWKQDTDRLKEEIKRKEERWKAEAEAMGKRYKKLVEEVQSSRRVEEDVRRLREEDGRKAKEVEGMWIEEIEKMKKAVEKSDKESEETKETARQLVAELSRLRRLMQSAGRVMDEEPDSDTS